MCGAPMNRKENAGKDNGIWDKGRISTMHPGPWSLTPGPFSEKANESIA